jgi:hypothetical protein
VFFGGARSPRYSQDQTVFLIGSGKECGCVVIMRSLDGGATWRPDPVSPPAGSQLVIPPGYPSDARLFVGGDPTTQVADYVAPGFGALFAPLPIPAGWLALPPDFDSGHHVAFTSVSREVVATDLDSVGVPNPIEVDPKAIRGPIMLGPPQGSGQGIFILASPAAVAAGVPSTTSPIIPSPRGFAMLACSGAAACSTAGDTGLADADGLSVAQDGGPGHGLVAYGNLDMALSSDGGRVFSALPLPQDATGALSAAVGSNGASGQVVFGLFKAAVGTFVARFDPSVGTWDEPTAQRRPGDSLLALTPTRVIELLHDGGILCSSDGGASWAAACPLESR